MQLTITNFKMSTTGTSGYNFRSISKQGKTLLLILALAISGCTTLDFDPPLLNDDVYRIQIENLSNTDVTYSPQVSLYYIDRKKNLELPNSIISPNEPAQLIAESKGGTYGVSVDVRLNPGSNTVRLFLERGSGTEGDFRLDKVVESKTGSGVIFIRFGEYY